MKFGRKNKNSCLSIVTVIQEFCVFFASSCKHTLLLTRIFPYISISISKSILAVSKYDPS